MTPTVLSIFIVCGCMASFMLLVVGHGLRQRYRAKRLRQLRQKPQEEVTAMNWKVLLLLVLAILLVVFSFVAPVVMTKMEPLDNDFDFSWTGQVGDTVGGLMNPFIALAGVIVTGLAFYMQYEANRQQLRIFREQIAEERERFEKEMAANKEQLQDQLAAQERESWLQQFENRFYEMLRLHKENVNEMELPAKRLSEVAGRETFEPYILSKRNMFGELKRELEEMLYEMKRAGLDIDEENFVVAYVYFFWGVENPSGKTETDNELSIWKRSLRIMRNNQFEPFESRGRASKLHIEAYRGHAGYLGHYYRHLYMMVKFVANQPEKRLKFKQKRSYLKVLRMQLSNDEQTMLFYNWLGWYGNAWQDEKNSFFVDYKMIHNLWYQDLFNCDLIKDKIAELKATPRRKPKGELFETDER